MPLVIEADDGITCLAWSAAGQRLAAGAHDGSVHVVGPVLPAGTAESVVARHPMGVRAVAWDLLTDTLASGGHDGRVRLTGAGRSAEGPSMGSWIHALAWHHGVLGVASGADVSAYDHDGGLVRRWPLQPGTVLDVGWSADRRWLLGAGACGLRAFDTDGASADPVWDAPWSGAVLALDMHPTLDLVAVADVAGEVRVLPVGGDEETVLSGYPDRVCLVSWCDQGQALAAEAADDITVWATPHGRPNDEPAHLVHHRAPVTALAAAPDSGLVASGSADGEVRIWAAGDGTTIVSLHAPGSITTLCWAPDGRAIAVGTSSGVMGVVTLT